VQHEDVRWQRGYSGKYLKLLYIIFSSARSGKSADFLQHDLPPNAAAMLHHFCIHVILPFGRRGRIGNFK
jgi:hypothetical protein